MLPTTHADAMAPFSLTRTSSSAPERLWATVTDFGAYGRWLPLTTMRVDEGEPRPGWGMAGLTGIGPLRFSDSMLVTSWEPPAGPGEGGRFRLIKTGRVLGGWADVRVVAEGGGSRLYWSEEMVARPELVGRRIQDLTDRVSRTMFGRAVDAMVEAAEAAEASR
jgi:hypothetical protein